MRVYSSVLLIILTAITWLLVSREPVSGSIIRTAGMLYQERGQDSVTNLYRIKLVNKTAENIPLTLRLEDAPGKIELPGHKQIVVKAEDQGEGIFFIVLPKNSIKTRKTSLQVALYAGDKKAGSIRTTFLGPVQ